MKRLLLLICILGCYTCLYSQEKVGDPNREANNINIDCTTCSKIAEEYYAEGVSLNNKFKYAEAIVPLQKAVEMGSIDAAYYLGMMYLHYEDATKGFSLILKAAEQGYKDAVFQVAELYYTGAGTTKDKEKAKMWYQKASALGDPNAKVYLGRKLF